MPQDSNKTYFYLSLLINIIFIFGTLFILMKYQVLLGSKSSFAFTLPRTAIIKPLEPAQTPGQQQISSLRSVLGGKILDIKDNTISLEVYGSDGSKKIVMFSINNATKYFKVSLTPGTQPQSASKTDVKVGDYISAVFETPVDINNSITLSPKTVNLLPPPPTQLPKK